MHTKNVMPTIETCHVDNVKVIPTTNKKLYFNTIAFFTNLLKSDLKCFYYSEN